MNTIRWFNYDDTDADTFKVYRSIPGIQFSFASVITEFPEFVYSVSFNEPQTIKPSTSNIDAFVNSFVTARGLIVNKTSDNLSVQIRLAAGVRAKNLKIFPCTLAEDLGFSQGKVVVPLSDFTLIATQLFLEQPDPYEIDDADGSELDTYRITSVKMGIESHPSISQMPLLPGVDYCVAEARFIDIQGRPVRGVEMIAGPAVLDGSSQASNTVRAVSDVLGRVSVPLIKNLQYRINIPAIGMSKFITTPEYDFIDLTTWLSTTAPDFSPNGDIP